MLAMDRATGELRDSHFSEFPSLLRAGDLLVLNDSRVIPARLYARRTLRREKEKPTGRIEVMLTEPSGRQSLARTGAPRPQNRNRRAACLSRPGRPDCARSRSAGARASSAIGCSNLLRSRTSSEFSTASDTSRCRPTSIAKMESTDRERYQTVFSRERGSVAAPTAGLHFTPADAGTIAARGVETARVTLHVGLGTFAPLRVERVDEVRLHRERYSISAETADAVNRARSERRRIVAVGTTVVRTLEAAAQLAGSAPHRASLRRDRHLHSPGFEFPRGRSSADQFPSAAVEPADAGERICGPGARAGGLSSCCGKPLPIFQLWRLHVSRVSCIQVYAAEWPLEMQLIRARWNPKNPSHEIR